MMELRKLYVLLAMVLSTPAMAEQGRVELVWDRWGVPHVFANTDEEAMYGLGYATARDRGFQMHYQLRMIQGRSAEVLGEVVRPKSGRGGLTNARTGR